MTYIGLLIVLAGLIAFFAVSQSKFATYANLINILETNSVLLIVAVGLTFTLLAGGFDLSIGGVLALSGVLLARGIGYGVPAGLAVLIIVLGALLFGLLVNGLTIARFGLNFFVVTIGSLALTRGLALAASGGEVIPLYEEKLIRNIGTYRVGDVPIPVIIAVVILVVAFLVTRYTGFGRMIYAVGGNAEAARLAGINVVGVRMAAYAICGALAGVAGVVEAGRLASASPLTDQGIELTAAAAVLLGGTSFTGGIGSMVGTLLGVIFLGVLQNGLIISSIAVYWQGVITGVVLIASVLLDKLRRNRLAA
jgi:ribose transport system permease protein